MKSLQITIMTLALSLSISAQATRVHQQNHTSEIHIKIKDRITCQVENVNTGYVDMMIPVARLLNDETINTMLKHSILKSNPFSRLRDCNMVNQLLKTVDDQGRVSAELSITTSVDEIPNREENSHERLLRENVRITFSNGVEVFSLKWAQLQEQ